MLLVLSRTHLLQSLCTQKSRFQFVSHLAKKGGSLMILCTKDDKSHGRKILCWRLSIRLPFQMAVVVPNSDERVQVKFVCEFLVSALKVTSQDICMSGKFREHTSTIAAQNVLDVRTQNVKCTTVHDRFVNKKTAFNLLLWKRMNACHKCTVVCSPASRVRPKAHLTVAMQSSSQQPTGIFKMSSFHTDWESLSSVFWYGTEDVTRGMGTPVEPLVTRPYVAMVWSTPDFKSVIRGWLMLCCVLSTLWRLSVHRFSCLVTAQDWTLDLVGTARSAAMFHFSMVVVGLWINCSVTFLGSSGHFLISWRLSISVSSDLLELRVKEFCASVLLCELLHDCDLAGYDSNPRHWHILSVLLCWLA